MHILVNMDIYQEISDFYNGVQAEKTIIGQSELGRNLYAVKVGQGECVGIVQYAIHGREFITAKLAIAHFLQGLATGCAWLLPLTNPDGALLSQKGLASVENEKTRQQLKTLNLGKEDFSLWKANARGVDLNVNFPARFGEGEKNIKKAGAENYIGEYPFSEKETQALRDFTKKINPNYTLSYHTKGEEIYWWFYQSTHTCPRDLRVAKAVSGACGYPIKEAKGSVGGYKDWCIQEFAIPSLTIEAGRESKSHPLNEEELKDIIKKNKRVLQVMSQAVEKENQGKKRE